MIPVGRIGALGAHQFIAFEPECQLGLGDRVATVTQQIPVIPAIAMKRVFDERCAHDVAHLAPVEAGSQLLNHLFGDHIALLNVDSIDPREAEIAAATDQAG